MSFMHDYYVSITNISYNKKSKELEFVFKFTAHDLEKAISNQYNKAFKLENRGETTDSLIKNYVTTHFKLQNTKGEMNYLGYEFSLDETCFVYFTKPVTQLPSDLSINNTLLISTFPLQENLTHYTGPNKQSSYSFRKGKETYTFKNYE